MNQELPTINQFSNVSNTYSLDCFDPFTTAGAWVHQVEYGAQSETTRQLEAYAKAKAVEHEESAFAKLLKDKCKETTMSTGRVVQVFICDPDKNVPLEKRLLFKGEQQFTDASDQDLFFDIDIKIILKAHNELRATLIDKAKSSSTEKVYLEPVRVSNLKMVVSELAKF